MSNPQPSLPTNNSAHYSSVSPAELKRLSKSFTREQIVAEIQRRLLVKTNERIKLETAEFDSGPLLWLTQHTRTENPKAQQQGLPFRNPFPQKTYIRELFKSFLGIEPYSYPNTDKPRSFYPKTREMLTSWAVMGYAAWRAQYHNWFVVAQTESENKAQELVEYVHQLYRNQDDGLKSLNPLNGETSLSEIAWKGGGRVVAIPKGANRIRLYHPTLYVMDEAAFLPEAEDCYAAAHPVTFQIIGISSADDGWFANMCQPHLKFNAGSGARR